MVRFPPPKKKVSNVYLDWLWSKHGKKGLWSSIPYWESYFDGWMIILPWVHECSRTLRSLPGCASQQTTGAQHLKRPTAGSARQLRGFPWWHPELSACQTAPGIVFLETMTMMAVGKAEKLTHYGEWMTLRSQVWGSKTVLVDRLPMHFHAITTHVISREHVVWSQDKRTHRMLISPWLTFCSEKSQEWSLEGHDCLATWSGQRTGDIGSDNGHRWQTLLGATEARCPMPPMCCRPTSWHLPLTGTSWGSLQSSQLSPTL